MTEQSSGYVLIVDDDADIGETLEMILRGSGYACRIAHDGSEALAMLQFDGLPKLVLLDLMMPGMNGYEFRERQLQDPRLAAIPVVVMSGDAKAEEKAATLGVTACLPKPVSIHELLAAVRQAGEVSTT